METNAIRKDKNLKKAYELHKKSILVGKTSEVASGELKEFVKNCSLNVFKFSEIVNELGDLFIKDPDSDKITEQIRQRNKELM